MGLALVSAKRYHIRSDIGREIGERAMRSDRVHKLDADARDVAERLLKASAPADGDRGNVLGIRLGGYNANSGAIGSFVFALPALVFVAAGAITVAAASVAADLFDRLSRSAVEARPGGPAKG